MILFFKKVHRMLYLFSVLLFFIPCYPILLFFATNPTKYYNQIVFFRKWITIISIHLVGIRFKINYESDIDWSRPYVICPNHTSFLDITALTYLCPQPFSFVGKVELLKNPLTRIFFKTIDITIDRSSRISAFRALKRGGQLLKEGKSLVIFPEGKIDDEYPPTLHQFKSGPFRMAIENNIPLLPVVIHDAWKILWDNGSQYGSRPGVIEITVLKPIETSTDPHAKYDTFEQEVYHKMQDIWLKKQGKNNLTITKSKK